MENHQQEAEQFGGRTVPPATPPTINSGASASDAVRADAGGDIDQPGRGPAETPAQPDRPSEAPPAD